MAGEVVWFEVIGKDSAALGQFYGGLFGWQLKPMEGMDYRTVDGPAEGPGIPGGIGGTPQGEGWSTFYVQVPDVAAAATRATEAGGSLLMPPRQLPDGATIAVIADPEGHPVGLFSGAA